MSWFKKLSDSIRLKASSRKSSIPEGLWTKCAGCQAVLFVAELKLNLQVCTKCGYHMPIKARERLTAFLDAGQLVEIGVELEPEDKLKFKDTKRYKDRLVQAQKATGEKDALVALKGNLQGIPVVACAFEFAFIGGSMGAVVGARFAKAAELALQEKRPLICFAASGGARMQESLISLMQMAKVSATLARLQQAQLPYISVMVNPCTGGVSASLAMLGDLQIAEPKALIGFAGPRVIAQTLREQLPEGFQRSEFLLDHGTLDAICDRRDLRARIARILGMLLNVKPRADQ